ncbi:CopG family transcriptional regulator [uncultured Arthrobacter sp.]|uniref:ribbon-helix-helix domain-containing protein n=1 Tax=uncultured Arthrobacter sp. TaxID=114050 RepID=UPI002627C371|nr:CopG family transcriptional regulator [uncultured Arthrobacter sp.]
MTRNNEPALTGQDQQRYNQLAEAAENMETLPESAVVTKSDGPGAGQSLLEAALGSPESVQRSVGRPSLSGKAAPAPVRSYRLTEELLRDLGERAEAEHRKPSEIVREALHQYLHPAS